MTNFLKSLIETSKAQQLQQYWIGDENQGASIDVMQVVVSELDKPKFNKNPTAQALLKEIRAFDSANNEGLKYAKVLAPVVVKSITAKVFAHIKA